MMITRCEAFLHSEAFAVVETLAKLVAVLIEVTSSTISTIFYTVFATGWAIALGGRGGRDFVIGIDENADVTSIKGYSPKVSYLEIEYFRC